MRAQVWIVAAIVAVALLLVPGAPASGSPTYYLSLGSSLAQGFQPIGGPLKSGNAPPGYNHGYADELFKLTRHRYEQLQEIKLGCGGETTTTFRFGGACSYNEGSQLAAAAAFLEKHGDDVAFVTIDIGGNDVIHEDGGGVPAIATNLPVILSTLRDAASSSVRIIGMNFYHPFLPPIWFGTRDLSMLQIEVADTVAFNDFLEGIYGTFGIRVADVESAFSVTDLTLQPSGVPRNVQRACAWTWVCDVGDIHPNNDGYRGIANAFLTELGD